LRIGTGTNLLDEKGYGRWGELMYEKLRSHGYMCTDYSMSNTDTFLYNLPENEACDFLKKERSIAENSGIEIFQVHGPWRWPPEDGSVEGRKERMDKMCRSIRMTAVLGCKYWVVHPLMPFGIHERGTSDALETYKINIEFMQKLLETAKQYDVTICLENMPMAEFSIATPQETGDFVRKINDDNFKMCLDTGHVGTFDELKIGDEVRKLGNLIKVLHVHDTMQNKDLHLFPYQGITDWSDFAKSLREVNFDGVFSLETKPPAQLCDSVYEQMSILYYKIADGIING